MSGANHPLNIGVFLVGMAKCGTNTLASILFQHPQITPLLRASADGSRLNEQNYREVWGKKGIHIMLSRVKGMHVDWDKGVARRPGPGRWIERGFDLELARLLPDTAQRRPDSWRTIAADCSPDYFDCEGAAEAIHGLYPDARIIVTLRHPTDWLYSLWFMNVSQGDESTKFAELYRLGKNEHKNKEVRERLARSSAGRCGDYLARWLRVFAKDKIKVMIMEEWSQRPRRTAQQCYRFIGVDDSFVPERQHLNQGKRQKIISYWLPVDWLAERYSRLRHHSASPHDAQRKNHREKTTRGLKRFCSSLHLYSARRYTPMPDSFRRQLDDHFSPQVKAVEGMLGRRIPAWHRG